MRSNQHGRWQHGIASCALGLALLVCSATALALDLPELQRLLQARPVDKLLFEEERSSPWLSQPLRSAGHLWRTGELLEKQVERPERATWQLRSDRMTWIAADGQSQRSVAYADSPAAGALAQTLRQLVSGELSQLADRFEATLAGDAARWSLRLEPRDPGLRRAMVYLEVGGRQGLLESIVLVERNGAVTTTQLRPASPNRSTHVRP